MPVHGNTFMGGMDKDTSKQKYANNKYSDAHNLRPVTDEGLSTGALENIKGTEELLKMKEIKGMFIITPIVGTTGCELNVELTSGVIASVFLNGTSQITDDNIFDQIEEYLTSQNIEYQRLNDEEKIVIYNPGNIVIDVNITKDVTVDARITIEEIPAVNDFIIIGHTPLRDKTILFTINEEGAEALSQIWSMTYNPTDPSGSAALALLHNGKLDFSKDHPIEALARYENTDIQRVYFTDNNNIPRTFNAVASDTLALRVKDFAIIIENDLIPALVTTEDQDGGSLPTGLWYVTYRLKKFAGASTPIAPFSGATAVTTSLIDTSASDPQYWDYAYATTIVNSTKILNYSIPVLPRGFDEITVYAVNEIAPGQFLAFLVKTETLTSENSYEFSLATVQDLEEIPIEDLKQYDVDFERVKTITAKYNRLLFGNVKEATFNLDFDARTYRWRSALDINTNTSNATVTYMGSSFYNTPTLDFTTSKTWGVPEEADVINPMNRDVTVPATTHFLYKLDDNLDYTNTLGGSGPNVDYEFTFKEITLDDSSNVEPSNTSESIRNRGTEFWPEISPFVNVPSKDSIEATVNGNTIDIGAGFTNFKNGRMESYFKGYMRDEVYRFGLVFYSKTGRASDVKWIGDIRMPCAGDFNRRKENRVEWYGALAQWYSKNKTTFENDAIVPNSEGETKGWMVGLKFTVDLSDYIDVKDQISGFSIVRAPRRQKDKTIIAEGALGEIASKDVHTRQTGADYLFRNLLKKVNFDVQVNTDGDPTTLPGWTDKWTVKDSGGQGVWTPPDYGVPGINAPVIRSIPVGYAGTNEPWGLIPVNEEKQDPGGNFVNTDTPLPGHYFDVPETGEYKFDINVWFNFKVEWTSSGTFPITAGGSNDFEIFLELALARKRGGTIEESLEMKEILFANSSSINTEFFQAINEGPAFGKDISGSHSPTLDCKVGDKIMAIARVRIKLASSGGSTLNSSTLTFTSILNVNGINNGYTNFKCLGFAETDYEKNKRLFNLTRILDGQPAIEQLAESELDNVYEAKYGSHQGGPMIRFGYNEHVKDDWSLGDPTSAVNSNHFTNVGEPSWQYATLDCPDLKFPTGTKVDNYFEENEEDQKYTLKPVAGYVHISENNPIVSSGTYNNPIVTPYDPILYTETSAVRGDCFSDIGHLYSDGKLPTGFATSDPDTIVKYSRYSKALALCHSVSFEDRLDFSTGGLGKVKELKKIENGGSTDVKAVDSINNGDVEDVKFLNVGFSTNLWEGFRFQNAGSALISPGVFTLFMAGANPSMTKFLLNYAFNKKATKDLDPYMGIADSLPGDDGNEPSGYYNQHNFYTTRWKSGQEGNQIGFYDADGSGTKTPRRGQIAIVDICRDLDNQYGGATFKERKDTEYISTGNFTRVTKDSGNKLTTEVFGGDIFQSAFTEKKLYSTNWVTEGYSNEALEENDPSKTSNAGEGYLANSPIIGRIYPIQSVVNTDNRVGYHFNNYQNYSTPFRSKDEQNELLIGASDFPVDKVYEAYRDDYFCPVLYSIEKKLESYLVTGQNILLGEFDNRIYMSQQKLNGELFDAWTVFKPLDYLDVDGHYGPINKLEVFNDQILFFQDKSYGIVALNPQSLVTDGAGGEVQLGTGKGLVTFRYISNAIGAFHQWGIVKGKGAMYFFDAYHRKFFRHSQQGPEPLSDLKGMSSWFFDKIKGEVLIKDNPILFTGITSVYDQRFSEAMFTFHLDSGLAPKGGNIGDAIPEGSDIPFIVQPKESYTIVFNEMVNAFTSFYSHFPRHYISDSKRIFSQNVVPDKSGYNIHIHDEGIRGVFYGDTAKSIIEMVINPKGDWTKVFNNLEYITQASDTTGDLVDVTFDRLKVSNEYQNSGDVTLVVDNNVKRRMRTWRSQVPRDGNARIRNPHMILKFEYDNTSTDRRIIIHDILTHYLDVPM